MNLPTVTFPNKLLKLTKITQSFGLTTFLGLFMFLVAAGIGWWQYGSGQSIYADHQISKNPQVLENAKIEGECKTRKFAFTDCKVMIRDGGKTWQKRFSFFDFSKESYDVQAIAAANNPELVSVDLAIDKIGNRIAFLAFFALVALFALWAGFYILFVSLPRQRKVIAAFNQPDSQPWQLVSVATNKQGNKYEVDIDGTPRQIVLQFGKNKPWVLAGDGNGLELLGIAPKNGGNPVPLDQKLSAISGLDKAERQALIARIHQHYA